MVIGYERRQKFWGIVLGRLHDEKERLVIDESFVLGLKPREIYDKYPQKFTDVDEVYKIKQNILARLRRDPELKKLLGFND
jgi:hypothetical protein